MLQYSRQHRSAALVIWQRCMMAETVCNYISQEGKCFYARSPANKMAQRENSVETQATCEKVELWGRGSDVRSAKEQFFFYSLNFVTK